jgi:hypothetical protein
MARSSTESKLLLLTRGAALPLRQPVLCVALMISFAASTTHAASIKDIFEKQSLIGFFAAECNAEVSKQNPYYVYRVIDPDHLQLDVMESASTPTLTAVIDGVAELGANEIRVSGTRNGMPFSSVYSIEPLRMRILESTVDGQMEIAGGRIVNGGEMPWYHNCTAQPAQTPPAQAMTAPVESQSGADSAAASGLPVVTGADIRWYGVYTAAFVRKEVSAGAPAGAKITSRKVKPPATNSDRIVLANGMQFGFGYRLLGEPNGAKIRLRCMQKFPPPGVFNKITGRRELSAVMEGEQPIGADSFLGFIVGRTADFPAGDWTFELWQGDRKLVEKTFAVSRP